MRPRIVTISDHIDCPTGFGVQHRLLAVALAQAGYDVHSLGIWDGRPVAVVGRGKKGDSPLCPRGEEKGKKGDSPLCPRGEEKGKKGDSPLCPRGEEKGTVPDENGAVPLLHRYPGGNGPDDHRRAWGMYHDLLRPDLVITLGDSDTFAHLNEAERDFAWCHWLPIDAEPYPIGDHERMLRYDHLVLMSHFGLALVRPHLEGRVPLHHIPHGVDTRVFRPHADPLALRRKWSERLGAKLRPTDFVLIARDTNQWRKQLPLLLDALAQLPRHVKLVLHCRPIAHPNARGWDLAHLARRVYGVADRVVFTGKGDQRPDLSPRELAELDNLADLHVSATQGEGFGICTIEAMACGTPTVITDYTTSRELVAGIADCRLPIADSRRTRSSPCSCAGTHGFDAPRRADARTQAGRSSVPDPVPAQEHGDERDRGVRGSSSSIGNRESQIGNPLDGFGPAGELIGVAGWTIEQGRHLRRPVIDTADLAAKVLALRDDPGRRARQAEAGLRRVMAHYTTQHVAAAWVGLARRALAARGAKT